MTATEGIIKYHLEHETRVLGDDYPFASLNACREKLVGQGWVGQDKNRYQGLGFGNISIRVSDFGSFLITGSQTGYLATLQAQHFALVTDYQHKSNKLSSQGLVSPSSEASTHGFLYYLSNEINAVIHIHSPELWRYAVASGLPCTSATAAYGSEALLHEVEQLWRSSVFNKCPLFVMLGHEDGIISFGQSLTEAAAPLWECGQYCHHG